MELIKIICENTNNKINLNDHCSTFKEACNRMFLEVVQYLIYFSENRTYTNEEDKQKHRLNVNPKNWIDDSTPLMMIWLKYMKHYLCSLD